MLSRTDTRTPRRLRLWSGVTAGLLSLGVLAGFPSPAHAANASTGFGGFAVTSQAPYSPLVTGASSPVEHVVPGMATNWDFAKLVLMDGGWPLTSNNEMVIAQWMGSENYTWSWWTRNNPLNNGLGSGGGSGLGSYATLPLAAYYIAANLLSPSGLYGYPAIAADLAASDAPAVTAGAIWASSWAGSHYGYGQYWYSATPPVVDAPQWDWKGASWASQKPGAATSVSVGADGSIWILGTNQVPGGYGVYQWTGSTWDEVPGAAVSIAVGPYGGPWVINSAHQIFHRVGTAWDQMPGSANQISIGADGTVWVVGTNPVVGGYGIYQWTGSNWTPEPGGVVEVALGPSGVEWAVNSSHSIYWNDNGHWDQMPGLATDVSVGADGSVWAVGIDTHPAGNGIYQWMDSWLTVPGQGVVIAGAPDANPWVVNSLHQIWAS
jgi:Tectonin domain